MRVESGDIIVGDRDGVVVIPQAQAETVRARLERVHAAESKLEARVKDGLTVPDPIVDLLANGHMTGATDRWLAATSRQRRAQAADDADVVGVVGSS